MPPLTRQLSAVKYPLSAVSYQAGGGSHCEECPSTASGKRGTVHRSLFTVHCSLSTAFQHLLGNRGQLHIRSAFVDLAHLGIAEVLLGRIVADEAVAAEDLHALAGHALGNLRGK